MNARRVRPVGTIAFIGCLLLSLLLLVACSGSGSGSGSGSNSSSQSQAPAAKESTPVELQIASGSIKGTTIDSVSSFKGIPYAKAPTGDLRFAPPQDADSWTEVLDCTEFGAIPMQASGSDANMSEDCLSINVWMPEGAKSGDNLPVYVWIYGGAFAFGSSTSPDYDGTKYAEQGVIQVNFNYRVNALGFYASQATYDAYGTTGNWGLLDQIKALEWVQKNIGTFGGDASNVTVGGESAGSYSTSALILSPLAEGLFQNAIMESGTILGVPGNNSYVKGNVYRAIELGNMFNKSFDVTVDDAAGLAKMRQADAGAIMQLANISMDFTQNTAYMMMPCYDGYVLPKGPIAALEAGQYNKVNLLIGYNKDEGSVFASGADDDVYHMVTTRQYGEDQAASVLNRFTVDSNNTALQRTREQIAYGMFTTGMVTIADYMADAGQTVYMYNFDYVTKANEEDRLGARHGSEIVFAFDTMDDSFTKEEKSYATEVFLRWVNFVKNDDPNVGDTLPTDTKWPLYKTDSREVLLFENEGVKSGALPDLDNQLFMKNIMYNPSNPYYL